MVGLTYWQKGCQTDWQIDSLGTIRYSRAMDCICRSGERVCPLKLPVSLTERRAWGVNMILLGLLHVHSEKLELLYFSHRIFNVFITENAQFTKIIIALFRSWTIFLDYRSQSFKCLSKRTFRNSVKSAITLQRIFLVGLVIIIFKKTIRMVIFKEKN